MCYDSSEQLCLEGGVTILCAIYTRLSKEDEDKRQPESESIQNQKSLLISYAVERGWDVYHIYCDEDYSGADSLRPKRRKKRSSKLSSARASPALPATWNW